MNTIETPRKSKYNTYIIITISLLILISITCIFYLVIIDESGSDDEGQSITESDSSNEEQNDARPPDVPEDGIVQEGELEYNIDKLINVQTLSTE